jgi:hypothetical protein
MGRLVDSYQGGLYLADLEKFFSSFFKKVSHNRFWYTREVLESNAASPIQNNSRNPAFKVTSLYLYFGW